MNVVMIDYGVGNLRSVAKALETVGADVQVSDRPQVIRGASKVVLPGVGAFGDGMATLRRRGLVEPILEAAARGVPLLGICLGMQLLLDQSHEKGRHEGLGLISGEVLPFDEGELKVPHTGWNRVLPEADNPLLTGLPQGSYAYFNHGYYCRPGAGEVTLAKTRYGQEFASVVGRDSVFGVQFHPEKSQAVGLRILSNFLERV